MADLPAGRFKVDMPAARADEVRRLADAATSAGKRIEFIRWLREAGYRLAHEADEWGESREPIPGGRVENRVGVAGDLTVWYPVDLGRAAVYVKEFRLRGDPEAGEQGGA